MYARAFTLVAMTSLSACVLTTNDAIHDLQVGMSVAEAEALLGQPTTVRDLGIVQGTTPAKSFSRECRTYRYVDHDGDQNTRSDRFTWVTYNAGHVAGFSDNGYASSNGSYCHG